MSYQLHEFHLGRDFGIDETKAQVRLRDAYTLAQALAKYPKFFEHENATGHNDEWCLDCSEVFAGVEHLKWLTHDGPMTAPNQSRAAIDFPACDFYVTNAISFAQGRYIGTGPNNYYPRQGGTRFLIWHERWKGDAVRNGIQTITNGNTSVSGYLEGARIQGFKVDARREACPTGVTSYAGTFWDMGSSSFIDQLFARGGLTGGWCFVRGTPASVGTISSFENVGPAVDMIGTDLSTINIFTLECDDNSTAFRVRAGYGRPGGGALNVSLLKAECGKRGKSGQIILDSHGATCANFGVIQMDHDQERVDAAFVMDTRNSSNPAQAYIAMVKVGMMRGWNYDLLLQHIDKQEAWVSPGDYRPITFAWDSDNGITNSNRSLAKIPHKATERLGVQTWNGTGWVPAFDRQAGTPKYVNTWQGGGAPVPPPVACTGWTAGAWSAWSACVNGQQSRTRTVTATPAGCTGTPPNKPIEVETQACTMPPQPAWTTIWSGGNVLVGTSLPINPPVTATKVKITDLIIASTYNLANYGRVVGTGAGKPSLQLHQNGYFIFNNVRCASTNAATVTKGVKWSGEVTIPSSAISCAWQTNVGQHGALVCSCAKLEAQ